MIKLKYLKRICEIKNVQKYQKGIYTLLYFLYYTLFSQRIANHMAHAWRYLIPYSTATLNIYLKLITPIKRVQTNSSKYHVNILSVQIPLQITGTIVMILSKASHITHNNSHTHPHTGLKEVPGKDWAVVDFITQPCDKSKADGFAFLSFLNTHDAECTALPDVW